LGYTPQAYHKHNKKEFLQHLNEGLILQEIDAIRKHQPRCGGRKLYMELELFFKQHNISMGRDKFFKLLKRNKLLVRKTKRNVYTTMSKHHYHRYPNLAKAFSPVKAHELWVADITYIPLKERFAYLFLITDAYSRKIVGYNVSDDMKVSSATVALKQALAQKPSETTVIVVFNIAVMNM
jgi:putative transposase